MSGMAAMASAVSTQPTMMATLGRRMRSTTTPPSGTESTLIHTARLTWKPAPPSEAPRETSTPGPKPSSTMKPTLNSIHMDPAVRASAQSRRGRFGMKRSAAREVPTPGASR